MDRRQRYSRNPWVRLIYLYQADKWPKLVREKFWCSALEYRDRAFIAAFVVQNGLDVNSFIEALEYCNPYTNAQKIRKIVDIIEYLSGPGEEAVLRRSRYYSYDLYHGEVLDLNGGRRSGEERDYASWVTRSGLAAAYVSPCQGALRQQREAERRV